MPELSQTGVAPGESAVARTQLRDEAADHIRELIMAGQASPGSLLRLAPLAERVGASVTPVREALLLIAQDGWVVQEPNRGFRVAVLRREDFADNSLTQALVAGELAARASEHRLPEGIVELRRLDERISRHDADDELVADGDLELHRTLYGLADAPRLEWFVSATMRLVPSRFWAAVPGCSEQNRTQHGPLIDAVEAGESDRARELMVAHVREAGDLLIAHLESLAVLE